MSPFTASSPTLHTTIAADGTPLEYLTLGSGPGVVILHGAMQAARSQFDLARLLAHACTVHLVNRRGKGRSGDGTAGLDTEITDLATVLDATGASTVFGVSSGAIIAARAAISIPRIERLVLFEPPLVIDGSLPMDFVEQFERELAAGDIPSAMVTSMLGSEMGPGFMARIPRFMLRAITRWMLSRDDKRPLEPGDAHMRDLVANLPQDFSIVREQADRVAELAGIEAETLLVSGAGTRPYLLRAVDELENALPHARRVNLAGADHGATQNRDDRGRPDLVAKAVLPFLGSGSPVRVLQEEDAAPPVPAPAS